MPKNVQGSFLDGMYKRSIDCKVMLHYDGKLNIGVKLGVVACFTLFYRVCLLYKASKNYFFQFLSWRDMKELRFYVKNQQNGTSVT